MIGGVRTDTPLRVLLLVRKHSCSRAHPLSCDIRLRYGSVVFVIGGCFLPPLSAISFSAGYAERAEIFYTSPQVTRDTKGVQAKTSTEVIIIPRYAVALATALFVYTDSRS